MLRRPTIHVGRLLRTWSVLHLGRWDPIRHLSWSHRRCSRHILRCHARHRGRAIRRSLRRRTCHCLTSTTWRCSTEDVGEGRIALGGRGRAKLGASAAIISTLLGLVLRHAASLSRSISSAAASARILLDIRPFPRVTAHSAVWALIVSPYPCRYQGVHGAGARGTRFQTRRPAQSIRAGVRSGVMLVSNRGGRVGGGGRMLGWCVVRALRRCGLQSCWE